jgi:O-antigen/teichoic acid export membrane protein
MTKNQLVAYSAEPESATDPVPTPSSVRPRPTDHSLLRSLAWSAAGDWGTQVFTWGATLQIMRLVAPRDYGIVAMAAILMPYMGQLTGLGFPRAVIALPDLTDDQLAQMNTLSLLSATTLFALSCAIAKPFAAFFKTPALAPVFIVSSAGLIMSALVAVPTATLGKQLRFRFLSILNIVCALTTALGTLVMAWIGLGYWALILGGLVASIIKIVVIQRVRPTRLMWPRFKAIREPLQFGWRISVSLVALNSYQCLDNFVAGRMLGATALGFYGMAWELANVPIDKVASLITSVIPAYLSAVQDQPAALRRYLRGLTEVIALGTFPGTVGLSLVAPEFVPAVFGHKWDGMIAPLQVLSFYAGFRSIMALLPKVLWSTGHVRYVMWNDLAALISLPVAFYIGSFRGTVGIAWAWVLFYPFIVLPLYHKTFKAIDMRVGEYLRALRPAATATAVMIPAVEWVRHSVALSRPLLVRLAIEVAAGALVYLGTLWLLHRDRVLLLVRTVKKVWQQKTSVTPAV